MPRYYFHLQDGMTLSDDVGIELLDLQAAKREALRFADDVLADEKPPRLWSGEKWSLHVSDSPGHGTGKLLLSLNVFAIDHSKNS